MCGKLGERWQEHNLGVQRVLFCPENCWDTCGKQMAGNSIHLTHIYDRFTSVDYCRVIIASSFKKLFDTNFHFGHSFMMHSQHCESSSSILTVSDPSSVP